MKHKILNSAILMTWLRDFVRFGTPLIVVPLVLAFYTAEEQTFYFWIGILFAFAMVADAGISSVVVRATSYFNVGADRIPKNREEFDQAEEFQNRPPNFKNIVDLFHTTKWIYLILTSFSFILLSTVGVAVFWNLMEQMDHRPDMWTAYGVLVLYFSLYMINIRWSSFMRGLDFVAKEARFNTIATSFRIIIWVTCLSFKLKPLALTLGLFAEGIAIHIFLKVTILNWLKKNNIAPSKTGKFNMQLFKTLWPAAWRMGGIQLGNFLVERGNNIIILQISDTALMANFTFTTWILKTIFGFSLTPVYSRLPVLYKFAAEKNFSQLRKATAGYMFLGLLMITVAYVVLGAFGNPLLEFLNYDRRLISPLILFAIMALTEILDIHSSFHAGVYTSTNHIPFLWPTLISGALIFVVGRYYALGAYGVAGIIMTRFLVQFGFNNWYAMILNLRFLKWPFFKFLVDVPRYGVNFLFSKASDYVPFLNRK